MTGLVTILNRDILDRGFLKLDSQARRSVVNHIYENHEATFGDRFAISMVHPKPRCIGIFGYRKSLREILPGARLNESEPTVLLNHPEVAEATQAIFIIELIANGDARIAINDKQRDVLTRCFEHCLSNRSWMIGSDLVDECPHPRDDSFYGRQWIAQVHSSTTIPIDGYPLSPVHAGTGIDLVVFSNKRYRGEDWLLQATEEARDLHRHLWAKESDLLCTLQTMEGLE